MENLRTLNHFVVEIEQYVKESFDYQKLIEVIFAYNDFLNQPIREEMFLGENPLFPEFIKCSQKYASENRIDKSFDNFGENEFSLSVRKWWGQEYGRKETFGLVTSYHLKTVNDLVGKIERYDSFNEKFGWNVRS